MLLVLLAATLAALPAPAVDPVAGASTLRGRVSDPAAIRAAVRQAIADTPAVPGERRDTALSGTAYPGFARAVDEARVPDCLHPDALKHQPAQIGPVALDGILALPFLAAAIVRGKCN